MIHWLPSALSYMIRNISLSFDRDSMFVMYLSSKQLVPNLSRVPSVLMVFAPESKWTHMNNPHASWMYLTNPLFMNTFTVDGLSSSIHNGLTAFPDTWFSFPLFRNKCSLVPNRMRRSIPVMLAPTVSGALISYLNTSDKIPKPST